MKAVRHIGEDIVVVSMENGEKFPTGSTITVDGVSYDVEEIIPPDSGMTSDNPVFAVRFRKTKQSNESPKGSRQAVPSAGKSGRRN